MDDADARELTRLLGRPGAVRDVDGLAVTVREVRVGHEGRLHVAYAVPPGRAHPPGRDGRGRTRD